MTKRLLCITAIVALVAFAGASAFAAQLYWNGTTSGGTISQGVANQTDGTWTTGSVFPDAWSASTAVSTVRDNTSPNSRTKAAYNTTSGQAAFATIEFHPTATGYWAIDVTNPAASLGTGAKTVTNVSGISNATWGASTDVFSTGNSWNNLGTFKATNLTPTIRFDEASTTTNRWYLDQFRLTSATPDAATLTGIADGAVGVALTGNTLSWTAGLYSSAFDVYFGTSATPTSLLSGDLAEGTTSAALGTLTAGTTYFWKVTAKNVDMSADSSVFSFTTLSVPEPSSMLAFATGLIGLVGIIRRKKA